MEKSFNIVNMIEKSSLVRLSSEYENRLLNKIKHTFTVEHQKIFVTSFYCFLKYDETKDFVVDFDNVWKWVGFARKDPAKRLLEKLFLRGTDYRVEKPAPLVRGPAAEVGGAGIHKLNEDVKNLGGAGLNREQITLTINTFKKFCLKACTKKADEIHDYYIKLEKLLHETIDEETNELREQLRLKDKNFIELSEKHFKLDENHKRIIYKRSRHTLKKGQCLYILKNEGDEVTDGLGNYIFGITKNLNVREQSYYSCLDPCFMYVMFTNYNALLESCIKAKYREILKTNERLKNVDVNELIEFVESVAKLLGIEYSSHTNIQEIVSEDVGNNTTEENSNAIKINKKDEIDTNVETDHFVEIDDEEEEDELKNVVHQMKKCTKCLVEYDLVTGFNKDNSKKDGFHSLCKVCGKEQKINFKERKRAEFVELVEKNCNICKETKPISNFIKHIYTKDGYVNNCTKCCNEVKSRARKMEKDNNVRYKCGCCNKEYSRKDTLSRHIKICPSKTTETHANLSTQQLENEVSVN